MVKSSLFVILIIILVIASWSIGLADLEHPNDYYLHASLMMTCGLLGQSILPLYEGQWLAKHPAWGTFIICNGLGLLKEFGVDSRADWHDVAANNIGIGGSIIIFKW